MVSSCAPPRLAAAASVREDREAAAWQVVAAVEDPEIPVLTLADLGIIRFVKVRSDGVLEVGLSSTYTGCPAVEAIRHSVERALLEADLGPVEVTTVLSPAWSSAWITPEGQRKLAEYGIAPPPATLADKPAACPRCQSLNTERISQFGSTPCKALHRCCSCLEPFESFKCI